MELTAHELKERDPKRFKKEYYKWQEYCLWDDWTDGVRDTFAEKWKGHGVEVNKIEWNIGYSQGDYAGFTGAVALWKYMQATKMNEEYPALYEAVCEDGSRMDVEVSPRGRLEFSMQESTAWVRPTGIFEGLDELAWDELVDSEWKDSGLGEAVEPFVRDICKDLYKYIREECEYLTSEEQFMESCALNDITFEVESDDETCA